MQHWNYFYKFLANFSPLRFGFEGLLLLQYGFNRCHSDRKEIQIILHQFGIVNDEEYFYTCILMLVFNIIFHRFITFLVLMIKMNPYNNRRKRSERILRHHNDLITKKN